MTTNTIAWILMRAMDNGGLRYVVDSNVWIRAFTRQGDDLNDDLMALKKAIASGELIICKITLKDLTMALETNLKKNEISIDNKKAIARAARRFSTFRDLDVRKYCAQNPDVHRCQDNADKMFLALADTFKAYALISNDRHIIDMGEYYNGVRLLRPREFIDIALPLHLSTHKSQFAGRNEHLPDNSPTI